MQEKIKDDTISRKAAIELIERMKPYHQDSDDIAEMIANMPPAQPKTTGMICGSCKDSDSTALYTTAKVRCQRSGELRFATDYCNLPPAQPDIIRCRNCKHFQKWRSEESAKKFGQIYECGKGVLMSPIPDDFCSRAERREE